MINIKNFLTAENVSAELVTTIKKDLKGAVKITNLINNNDENSVIKKDDIITEINNDRVSDLKSYFAEIETQGIQKIELELIRDGKIIKVKTETEDLKQVYLSYYLKRFVSICYDSITKETHKTSEKDIACLRVKDYINSNLN